MATRLALYHHDRKLPAARLCCIIQHLFVPSAEHVLYSSNEWVIGEWKPGLHNRWVFSFDCATAWLVRHTRHCVFKCCKIISIMRTPAGLSCDDIQL